MAGSSSSFRIPPSTRAFLENRANFDQTAAPRKIVHYNSCSVENGGAWATFPPETTDGLFRQAFVARTPTVSVEMDGVICLVDFQRMLLVDATRGHERSIAWMDVEGRVFIPKRLVACGKEGRTRPEGYRPQPVARLNPNVPDLNQLPPCKFDPNFPIKTLLYPALIFELKTDELLLFPPFLLLQAGPANACMPSCSQFHLLVKTCHCNLAEENIIFFEKKEN